MYNKITENISIFNKNFMFQKVNIVITKRIIERKKLVSISVLNENVNASKNNHYCCIKRIKATLVLYYETLYEI